MPCTAASAEITAVAVSRNDTHAATVGCDGNVSLFDMTILVGEEPWEARIGGTAEDDTAGVGVTFVSDETVIVTRVDGRVQAFEADAGFAPSWSFDVGAHAGIPVVRDGKVWVGAAQGPQAGTPGGAVAMPLDVDALVTFAASSVTR